MTEPRLAQQFAFLLEAEKLKSVTRATPIADNSRRENSAEHSWTLALYALVLPLWARLRHVAALRGAVAAVNAAVVGLLASAWLSQLAPHALISLRTLAVAGLLLTLATLTRLRPLVLVALGAGLGAVLL